jgi:hypothetical protein
MITTRMSVTRERKLHLKIVSNNLGNSNFAHEKPDKTVEIKGFKVYLK